MLFRGDFHIHSCLSPCASLDMSPAAIVKQAQESGLNALALTDHNCTFNLPVFAEVCAREGMACLYGIEVNVLEEAHVLGLFDCLDSALELGKLVYESLPDVPNQAGILGDQPIVNEKDEILGFAEKTLYGASSLSLHSLLEEVHHLGGLCIPAHIARPTNGIISQLGFIPDEDFDAVELRSGDNPELAGRYPVLRNSDSHFLESIGAVYNELEMESLSVENLMAALSL